jgi:hypothetical protein
MSFRPDRLHLFLVLLLFSLILAFPICSVFSANSCFSNPLRSTPLEATPPNLIEVTSSLDSKVAQLISRFDQMRSSKILAPSTTPPLLLPSGFDAQADQIYFTKTSILVDSVMAGQMTGFGPSRKMEGC